MASDRLRLLAWAATIQNATVTALVVWTVVLSSAAVDGEEQPIHVADPLALAKTKGLGYVGVPTILNLQTESRPALASATIIRPPES